jgi:aminoglycoside phosphotransferase family enzyme/predicted kinase
VPDLVRDLLRPDAYGSGAPPVSMQTTHGSWVFLTGDDVWKVKRPVDLGFLDFRDPHARRHFCEEEVRLNHRLAPDVYLGVDPIRLGAQGHVVGGGEGEVVDWAVHMRRLPDHASAASMLSRGVLGAEALGDLARRLAAFFRAARATPHFGEPQSLRANVEENFAQVERFVGDVVDQQSHEDVRRFQLGALEAGRDRFAARVRDGRIREGHGDLRLEHVYFLPGVDPVAIDCIEFNERFRCGDSAGEAAFLAMELEAARRPDLAAGFLARFAEESDDFGLYGVLDFYLSYRAFVRGKVAAFLAGDAAAEPELRQRKREEARRRFGLARSFCGSPVDAPVVILVTGVIGSGKSTLAAALGRELALPIVSSDRTRKALAGLAPTQAGGAALYAPDAIEGVYREVLRRGGEVLAARRGVILDATFSTHRWRTAAFDLARAAGARFVLVETRCADRDRLRARLAARRHAASVSDATDDQLDELLRRYEPLTSADPGPRLSIDTDSDPDFAPALERALVALRAVDVLPARERLAS